MRRSPPPLATCTARWIGSEAGRLRGASVPDGAFDAVVDCAWEDQARLAGAGETRNIRLKAAAHLAPLPGARCLTLVQGPFGDVVQYGDHVYASWYPDGRLSNASAVAPSPAARDLARDTDRVRASAERQVAALEDLGMLPGGGEIVAAVAGFILGHGAADIDRRRSGLHRRGDFGIDVRGRMLAPRNFKLTTAPLAASLAVAALEEAA